MINCIVKEIGLTKITYYNTCNGSVTIMQRTLLENAVTGLLFLIILYFVIDGIKYLNK